MSADDLVQRGRQLASGHTASQQPAQPASPLQDGEDLDSVHVDEADHWVAVYSELAEFRCDLLREIDRQARGMSQEQVLRASRNRRAFQLELQRIERHLDFWRRRRQELRANAARP